VKYKFAFGSAVARTNHGTELDSEVFQKQKKQKTNKPNNNNKQLNKRDFQLTSNDLLQTGWDTGRLEFWKELIKLSQKRYFWEYLGLF